MFSNLSGQFTGELAAMGTAFFWAFSSIFFTIGGRRIGAQAVNLIRLVIALFFIGLAQWLTTGYLFDTSVKLWQHELLFLSAFVGLVIGDGALFYAFVKIGTRLSMLTMSLVPVLSALLALVCFGESLSILEWCAIVFAVSMIISVVSEKRKSNTPSDTQSGRDFFYGVLFAVVGACGQAGNLIITKYALDGSLASLQATFWRMLYASLIVGGWAVYRGQWLEAFRKIADHRALLAVGAGAFFGPFMGIWLSYIAISETRVAVASVIMATPPLLLIPLSAIIFKESITWRSVIGTLMAIGGISVLVFLGATEETPKTKLPNDQTAQREVAEPF